MHTAAFEELKSDPAIDIDSFFYGGTSLNKDYDRPDWYPIEDQDPETGELTDEFLTILQGKADQSPDASYEIIWVQGESDVAPSEDAQNYLSLFEAFKEQIEAVTPTVSFKIMSLTQLSVGASKQPEGYQVVLAAQKELAIRYDNVFFIDVDQLALEYGYSEAEMFRDNYHFSPSFGDLMMRKAMGMLDAAPETRLHGTIQNDELALTDDQYFAYGSAGDDKIYGSPNDDFLDGGLGNDTLHGGDGDDTYYVYYGDDAVFEQDGQGFDEVLLRHEGSFFQSRGAIEKVNAATIRDDLEVTIRGSSSNEHILGSRNNDTLSGRAGDDKIHGGSGDDLIFGGHGNDRIFGQAGNDLINAGSGNDVMAGGAGLDTYIFSENAGDDSISDFNSLEDSLALQGVEFYSMTYTSKHTKIEFDGTSITLKNVLIDPEELNVHGAQLLSDGTSEPPAGANIIRGSRGVSDDELIGTSVNDILRGGGGDDDIFGGSGDDLLVGGVGNDKLAGGEGADTFRFNIDWGDNIIEDFDVGEDALHLKNKSGLSSQHIEGSTLISFDNTTITLQGVVVSDIDLLF